MSHFTYSLLGDKNSRSYLKNGSVLFGVLIAAAMTILNHVMIFEHFYAIVYAVILMVYSVCRRLRRNVLLKLFGSIFTVLLMAVSAVLTINYSTTVFNISS